jgi:acetyltransferase EpsM
VTRLVIVGAGGHGAELLAYCRDLSDSSSVLGFVDEFRPKGPFGSSIVLGGFDDLRRLLDGPEPPTHYLTAVGDNRTRERLVTAVEETSGGRLLPWTLRHPHASIGAEITIGAGTCLAPGTIVTTRACIGSHVIMNVKASVSHDTVVDDFVNLNPGSTLCGNVRVGRGAYIGAGATVIERITIGEWTVVGAGSVVISDLPSGVTAVGVPARIISRHQNV